MEPLNNGLIGDVRAGIGIITELIDNYIIPIPREVLYEKLKISHTFFNTEPVYNDDVDLAELLEIHNILSIWCDEFASYDNNL